MEGFSLPRIATCDIAMACKLHRIDEVGNVPQLVIYGEILSLYVNDDLIVPNDKGRLQIDTEALDPLSRLGGSNYSSMGEVLKADRPK